MWSLKSRIAKWHFRLACTRLNRRDIAIDCGANVGLLTLRLALSGARVFAFEPNPYAFAELSNRLHGCANVTLIQKAVGERAQKLPLYLHEKSRQDPVYWSTGSSLLDFKGNIDDSNKTMVEVVDLVAFIESLDRRIAILKIDIEGAEPPLLRRLITSGTVSKIDRIYVETHEAKIPELRREMSEIRKLIAAGSIKNINLNWA